MYSGLETGWDGVKKKAGDEAEASGTREIILRKSGVVEIKALEG